MFPKKNTTASVTDFDWNEFLEKGAYGQVHRATDKYSGRVFAIKKIDKFKIKQQNMLSQIWTEISIMYQIKHRNIVRIFDHFESQHHLYLVMEYVQKGSLLNQLSKSKQLSELRTKAILRDIIQAVEYLHKRKPPIIHRDIKPQNILIDEKDNAKLADFGWSNYSNYLRVTYCGTESYLAPQMVEKLGHDERLDYWCLGVLAYELLTGFSPFDSEIRNNGGDRRKKLHQNILNLNYALPDTLSSEAKSFIAGLLQLDPNKRMNIEQMKQHPFLNDKMLIRIKDVADSTADEDGFLENGEALAQMQRKRNQNETIKRLTQKLRNSESIISGLTQHTHYQKAQINRLREELEEVSILADQEAEKRAMLENQNNELKNLIEQYQVAQTAFKQTAKANRQLMSELTKLRQQEQLRQQSLSMKDEQLKAYKEHWEEQTSKYLQCFAENEQLKLLSRKKQDPQKKSCMQDEQFKQQLRHKLQDLQDAFELAQSADASINKQLKYQKLLRQIADLKQLECQRQRDIELLIEKYEERLCDMVNLHNLQIQRMRREMRLIQQGKVHNDLLIDCLLSTKLR